MNYGYALLQAFCGNNLSNSIENKQIIIPNAKIISEDFLHFLSKCIYRNIEKRYSWDNFETDNFVNYTNNINNKINSNALLDTEKLDKIFDSLMIKFENIIGYYKKLELNAKTQYIEEILSFMILLMFEIRIIIEIFDRNETKQFTNQNEISFINIFTENENTKIKKFNLNFKNPLIANYKIIDFGKDNQIIKDFLFKARKYLKSIIEIIRNLRKFSKNDLIKQNYDSFIKNLLKNFEESKLHEYFFSFIRIYDQLKNEKKYVEAYKELTIAEYLCEYILFIKGNIFEKNDNKIIFNQAEYINSYFQLFKENNNKIEISVIKLKGTKPKYLIISFLVVLFRSSYNNTKEKRLSKQRKQIFDGLLNFYPSLMNLIIKAKEKLEKVD